MAKAFKPKFAFGPRQWAANLHALRRKQRRGPVQSRIQRGRISGTTWPTGEIAIAERPRVLHNIQYKP
jgi:hypothetical protein